MPNPTAIHVRMYPRPNGPARWTYLERKWDWKTFALNSFFGLWRRPFQGSGYVAGVVTVAGSEASRTVYLFDRVSGVLVAKTTSDAQGAYRFDGVAADRQYIVLATDADHNHYNAAVADMIEPATE